MSGPDPVPYERPERFELPTALSLALIQAQPGTNKIEFHLINIGAGHSVPTGSNRRGLYLRSQVVETSAAVVATNEWLFAPYYSARPDDRSYLEEDKKRPDSLAVLQADAQGPHEPTSRAGEERILTGAPVLKPGQYVVRAELVYDLNRYNDPKFIEDQTTHIKLILPLDVKP